MRLKILLVFFLLINFIKPTNSYAWWGINEADKKYCMDVASNEKNEFSAKLSYKACLKEQKKINEQKEKQKKLDKQKDKLEKSLLKKQSKLKTKYCKEYADVINQDSKYRSITNERRRLDRLPVLEEIINKLKKHEEIKSTKNFELRMIRLGVNADNLLFEDACERNF